MLMGVNVFLFVIVQIGLEPWRRQRLILGFEEKVKEVIAQTQNESGIGMVDEHVLSMAKDTLGENVTALSETETTMDGEQQVDDGIAVDLVGMTTDSENEVATGDLEKKDLWISAAGGAVVGALLTAVTTYLLGR
jgi:hypothetical protein